MSFRDVRWPIIILILVLTLGLLLGASQLYQRIYVEAPLQQVLQGHQEIKEWNLNKNPKAKTLTIKMGPVKNLLETCTQIKKEAEPFLGKEGWELQVLDQRSPELEQFFYSIQYVVFEALAQGNFTSLAETLEQEAEKAGLDRYAIYVNNHYLFLQLQDGEANLYEILPRKAEEKPPVTIVGGSER
ncbi:MAG: hypothetical protein QHH02_02175 [Syntrophomonadaceae bacterium]|nr:hypothetical protein [Syntrophomonadaceae bacterium]